MKKEQLKNIVIASVAEVELYVRGFEDWFSNLNGDDRKWFIEELTSALADRLDVDG